MDTPRIWSWGQENKIFSCLMAFFLSNMLETHFLSTGAFEISLNDVPIWSKLQSGYCCCFCQETGLRSCFTDQWDCGLWHNEGLCCKQHAVSAGSMLGHHTHSFCPATHIFGSTTSLQSIKTTCIHSMSVTC
ncbi:hypothetical protein Q8A67_013334 [Cirrhinus molitorella]|uniref:Selenoprotein T n=1 Tax=Cirrhinus molitorella TaxID=172907 RepID=A0AA88PMY9_9TELE|nr:hypothetical protein Q8A67_013334 [Cirrhinus molitorella]